MFTLALQAETGSIYIPCNWSPWYDLRGRLWCTDALKCKTYKVTLSLTVENVRLNSTFSNNVGINLGLTEVIRSPELWCILQKVVVDGRTLEELDDVKNGTSRYVSLSNNVNLTVRWRNVNGIVIFMLFIWVRLIHSKFKFKFRIKKVKSKSKSSYLSRVTA